MQVTAKKKVHSQHWGKQASQKNLKVVENIDAISVYPFRLYIILLLLIGLALFLKVFLMIAITRDTMRVEKSNQNIEKLEMSNAKLRLDIARLKAPGRIQKLAAKRLNMVNPTQVKYIYLPEEIIRQDIDYQNKVKEKTKKDREKAERVRFIRFLSTVTSRIGVVALGDFGFFKK